MWAYIVHVKEDRGADAGAPVDGCRPQWPVHDMGTKVLLSSRTHKVRKAEI